MATATEMVTVMSAAAMRATVITAMVIMAMAIMATGTTVTETMATAIMAMAMAIVMTATEMMMAIRVPTTEMMVTGRDARPKGWQLQLVNSIDQVDRSGIQHTFPSLMRFNKLNVLYSLLKYIVAKAFWLYKYGLYNKSMANDPQV